MQYGSRKYILMHCTVGLCNTYFWSSYRERLYFAVNYHIGETKRNTTKIVLSKKTPEIAW